MMRPIILDSLAGVTIIAALDAPTPVVEFEEKKRVNKYSGKPDPLPYKPPRGGHYSIGSSNIMRSCASVTIPKTKKNVNRPPGHKRRKERKPDR